MNFIFKFVLISVLLRHATSTDSVMLRTRNQLLRLYVFHKKTKIQDVVFYAKEEVKERTRTAYNYMKSKYYDANLFYYSLSEEDRDIIDRIIGFLY